jgi:hypothetical protein
MTICKYHARGFCIRGHLCRFEHDSNKEPQPGHQAEPSQSFTLRAEAKEFLPPTTRECLFFQAGLCRNGDACRFQHSSPDTDSTVITSASWDVASPNVSLHRSWHAHMDNVYRKRDLTIAHFLPQTFRYDPKEPSSDLVPMVKSKMSNFLPMNVPWLKKSRTACR